MLNFRKLFINGPAVIILCIYAQLNLHWFFVFLFLSLIILLLGSVPKAGKKVASRINNRSHLWQNRMSDGFLIMWVTMKIFPIILLVVHSILLLHLTLCCNISDNRSVSLNWLYLYQQLFLISVNLCTCQTISISNRYQSN